MTKNEVIETIRTWIQTIDDEYDIEEQGRVYGLMEALELIKQIEPEQKWIPVSERLPDIHNYSENYFVTLKRGGVNIAMFTECDGKHWWTYDDVIAWMPLPQPYEPQESEEV